MTQKQLSEKIGVHERTIRKWSPRKRQQWQSLAAKGRDLTWFDLLAQLCFEVDAFNAANEHEWLWMQIDCGGVKVSRFHTCSSSAISHWDCRDSEKLSSALFYVKSLNN